MSPLCTQRLGHVVSPLSAQSVSVCESVCPIHFSSALSIPQVVKHETLKLTLGRCRLVLAASSMHCQTCSPANTRRKTSAGLMLGQRRRRWAGIVPALGQNLLFAGVLTGHIVFRTCEDIKTVAQMIDPKDDLVTVDIKNGFHHIKTHSLYCPQEPFINIYYKSH